MYITYTRCQYAASCFIKSDTLDSSHATIWKQCDYVTTEKEGEREGGREGGRKGGREGGKEGVREGGKEEGRE